MGYTPVVAAPLTAKDLWPLVEKLPHDEQVRLAKLALRAASRSGASDAAAYRAEPTTSEEFGDAEDALSWDGEGWDAIDAPR